MVCKSGRPCTGKPRNQVIGCLRRNFCSLNEWCGRIIPPNLEAIWEMSIKTNAREDAHECGEHRDSECSVEVGRLVGQCGRPLRPSDQAAQLSGPSRMLPKLAPAGLGQLARLVRWRAARECLRTPPTRMLTNVARRWEDGKHLLRGSSTGRLSFWCLGSQR